MAGGTVQARRFPAPLGGPLRGGGNQLVRRSVTGANECRPVFARDAVALGPGADRGNGLAGQVGNGLNTGGPDDLAVGSHGGIMQNAYRDCKRLLRNGRNYSRCMTDPAERLRIARLRAGYETGKDAAEALGIPVSTYLGHENGSRGITAKQAEVYARKYKVREQWLLYGVGQGPGDDRKGDTAEIVSIVEHLPPLRREEALRILRVLSGDKST